MKIYAMRQLYRFVRGIVRRSEIKCRCSSFSWKKAAGIVWIRILTLDTHINLTWVDLAKAWFKHVG